MPKAFVSIIILFIAINAFGQSITPIGPITLCTGNSQTLTITGAPAGSTYQWLNNNIAIAGQTASTHLANTAGSYTAVVTSGTTIITTNAVTVTIISPPSTSFTFAPNNVCTRIPIQFTSTSSNATSYSWNFNDPNSGTSNTSTQPNPVHTFIGQTGNGTQNFNVQLTATNAGCSSGPVTLQVTTKKRSGTELNGTGLTTYNGEPYFTRCVNSAGPFTFTNGSTTQSSNTHYTITWGDGSPDYDAATFTAPQIHTYNVGTYPILFIVTGPSGCIDTGFYHAFVGSNPAVGLSTPGNTTICTGDSLTFKILGTASNPPGTIYTFSFADGSIPLQFLHPPPDSITHVFNNSSCNNFVPGYNNSFEAKIVASNPCNSSTASVAPIYVSRRGQAQFGIFPKDTVCINNVVSFINTSLSGLNVSGAGCFPGKSVWIITPSTGWTISSGTLGNDFGSTDPTIWNSGSTPLNITFSIPGNYSIKLKTGGSAQCGLDSISRPICVNPTPTGSFTLDQDLGCAPLSVKTQTTTNTPFCGIYKYLWSVTYNPIIGCTPVTSSYSFINGTNANSKEPELTFTNPGAYTLGLIVIAPAATCSTALFSKLITVKEKPTVTLTAPTLICDNQSINPSIVASCYAAGGTFSWTFTGGTPGSANTLVPGPVSYASTGNYLISVDVTNECGTTSKSQPIAVSSVTTANAGPPQILCGTSATMAGNTPIVGAGIWSRVSGPSLPTILAATTPNATMTGLIPGTYIFKWTITNGICVSISNVTITIVTGGTTPNAGPDQSLCLATSTTLTGNTPVNGTGTWSIVSGPGTPTFTNPLSPSTTVTNLITGVYIFRWSISFSNCATQNDNIQVTVSENPSASDAGPDQTVCSAGTTLSATAPAIGIGQWSLVSGPNPAIIQLPFSPNTNILGMIAGTYVFRWTITSGACVSTTDVMQVVVTGIAATAAAGPDQLVCNQTTISLAGNNPGLGSGTWTMISGTNTPTIVAPNSASTNITGLVPGSYTFRYTISNGVCGSTFDDVSIINTPPMINQINGRSDTVCIGNPYTTTALPASGGNNVTPVYQWQTSSNGITFSNIAGATSVNYSLSINANTWLRRIATIGPCTGFSDTIIIVAQSAVTNNNINGDATICINTSAPLIVGTIPTGGNGTFAYQWERSIDNGVTYTQIIGAVGKDYSPGTLTGTTKYRRRVSTSACSGPQSVSSNVITITVNPDAKAIFNPTDTIKCSPYSISASVVNVQVSPANGQYLWYIDNGFYSSGIPFTGYTMTNGDDTIVLKLVTNSAFGCKADSTSHMFITRVKPVPSFTISDTLGCGPIIVQIQNTSFNINQYTYQWIFGNGQTSTSTQPGSRIYPPNPAGGDTTYTLTLKAFSVCDTILFSKTIRVKSKPKALFTPTITIGCSPMHVTFRNTSRGGNITYTWDFDDGTSLVTNNGDSVQHTFFTGVIDTFYVKLVAVNECGIDSIRYAIIATPNTIRLNFAMNGPDHFGCAPHSVALINNTTGGISFTWNFGDGNTLNTTKNIDTVYHTYLSGGTYTVSLHAQNTCSDTTATDFVTVHPKPVASFIASPSVICRGDTIKFTNLSDSASGFFWRFGDGFTSNLVNPVHVYSAPGTYTITLRSFRINITGSICQDSTFRSVQVMGPYGSLLYNQGYACYPNQVRLEAITNNTDSLIWNFGDGSQLRTIQRIVFHTYANPGYYLPSVSLQSNSGCNYPITGIDTIKVDRIISGFTSSQLKNCGSTIVTFSDTSNVFFGKMQVKWNFGDNTNGTGISAVHTYNIPGTYPVQMIVIGNSGCSDTIIKQVTITVNPRPSASILADTARCTTQLLTFSSNIQSTDPVTIRKWSISNGATGLGPVLQYTFTVPGTYTVSFIAGTVNGCYDTAYHSIIIRPSPFVLASADINICQGNSAPLFVSGALQYQWTPSQGLSCTTCFNPTASPLITTPYVVEGKNSFGCPGYDTVLVKVIPPFNMTVSANDTICIGQSANLLASGATSYSWSPALGLSSTIISNPVATPLITSSYRVIGNDGYNCFSDTAFVIVAVGQYPKVDLGPDVTLPAGNFHPLASTIVNGPIRTWLWIPARDLNCSSCPLPIATVKKDITYIVTVTNNYGCAATDSVSIKVFCESSQVFIPNAFTPDGDGINDVLMVRGSGIVMVKTFRIFNRWGELVFERNNFTPNIPAFGWDGRVKGVVGAPEVYVYTAEVVCENEVVFTYKGNVTILK